jgi:very-short-patch-repair endonuclease
MHQLPLPADEIMVVEGIRVTTVARTLLDLAAVLPRRQVERAVNEAEIRGLTGALSLADLVERYPRRHGIPAIRAILGDLHSGAKVTRSDLESRFQEFVTARGLPTPELNASLRIGGRWLECDCVWPPQRLVVELDGHAVHNTRAAFERDRERDRTLSAAGWRVVRITWRQLRGQPERVAADLGKMLLG